MIMQIQPFRKYLMFIVINYTPSNAGKLPISDKISLMKLYRETEEIWGVLLSAFEKAEKTILFEQYLMENDSISERFVNVLTQKAKSGVEVRCLFDAVGSFFLANSPLATRLTESGVKLEFFNWLSPFAPSSNHRSFWYFRNHRRNIIIDYKIAFTGSICVGEEMKDWIETEIEIDNPITISRMVRVFNADWQLARKDIRRRSKKIPIGSDGLNFITNSPIPSRHFLYKELIKAIQRADHFAYLTTPYFIPDNRLIKSLRAAVRRGVDVRLIIPLETNHYLVDRGSHTYFEECLKVGIKIYRHGKFIHSKTAVIDGWATVGSMNLDMISLWYNFEGNICGDNQELVSLLKKGFLEDMNHSIELTLDEWLKRPLKKKLLEALIWPFRKLL